jgi:GDP-4-dehydro-6-deoxy-D-mannose reductase
VKIEVRQNEKLFRPVDFPRYIGSNNKLTSEMDWNRTVPLEDSLMAILSYWRDAVQPG